MLVNALSGTNEVQKTTIDATVHAAIWHDARLSVVFDNIAYDAASLEGASLFLELYSNSKTYMQVEALWIPRGNGAAVGSFDLAEVCESLDPNCMDDVRFRLIIVAGDGVFATRPANSERKTVSSFYPFFSGYYASHGNLILADEAANKDYVLRFLGAHADPSSKPYAVAKKNRPWQNCLLFQSLAYGCGYQTAQALQSGELQATVRIADDGTPLADCVVDSKSFSVELTTARGLRPLSLINEGQTLYDNLNDNWIAGLHNLIFETMVEFDDVCRKNDINYLLAYGTLLGAVRHDDLIPWDYDADFYMLEFDYLKLRKAFDEGRMPENRQLDDWMSVPGYPGSFGRYMRTDSVNQNGKESRGQGGVGGYGEVTDVFYLIPAPGTDEEIQDRLDTFLAYDELANQLHRSRGTRTESFVAKYEGLKERCESEGREKVLDELREFLFGTDDGMAPHYIVTASSTRLGEVYPAEWLAPIELTIRGRKFFAPGNYLEMLRKVYGPRFRNYPKKRTMKEVKKLESLRVPYKVVEREYLAYCDSSQILADRSALKEAGMEDMLQRRRTSPGYYRLDSLAFAMAWEAQLAEGLAENKSDRDLDDLYDQYYQLQLSSKYTYWPVLVPVSDAYMAKALEHLVFFRGDSAMALEILEIRRELGKEFSDELQVVDALVQDLTSMRDMFDYGKIDDSVSMAKTILSRYPRALEADALLDAVQIDSMSGEPLKSVAANLLRKSAETDCILPLVSLADVLQKEGNHALAIAVADYVVGETDDGMLIKHLNKTVIRGDINE